jgi:RimJ/RimL family protein N-acetyltransferase
MRTNPHVLEPSYPLETERLLLRPFEPGDFDALFAMHSRADVAQWLPWDARTEDDVRVALEKKLKGARVVEEGDTLTLAALLKPTGELVGDFILHYASREHRAAEIGFIVHPDHQRRGYATEVATVLLDLGFRDLKLHRVYGRVEARNGASARVLEKLGMRREAHFVENEFVKGEWQSELVYAILDHEWLRHWPDRAT